MKNKFGATIIFQGDSSVGERPRIYTMELDEEIEKDFKKDKDLREEYRNRIKKIYENMDCETCTVIFSFETLD